VALLAVAGSACGSSAASEAHPRGPLRVTSASELLAALQPANDGRLIEIAAGEYEIDRPLSVPDGATLVGAGSMSIGSDGLPAGFAAGKATTLRVTAAFEGDVLTLGNRSRIERLRLLDLETPPSAPVQRRGNVVSALSRGTGDVVEASVQECEIVNPNRVGFTATGPLSHGIVALTLNPGLGSPPGPHAGARVHVVVRRSFVRTNSGAVAFANNFAPGGEIGLLLEGNRFEGYLIAAGGTTRPDQVHDARTIVESRGNLYLHTGLDRHGWHVMGASTSPHVQDGPGQGAAGNLLHLVSEDDRIEGFRVGIQAAAARRLGVGSEPLSDNRLELDLRGTRILTQGEGAADLNLRGTFSEVEQAQGPADFAAGDRNVMQVRMQGVRGSGPRNNVYGDVVGPRHAQDSGTGNRLRFLGDRAAFLRSNQDVRPAPPAGLFEEESGEVPAAND